MFLAWDEDAYHCTDDQPDDQRPDEVHNAHGVLRLDDARRLSPLLLTGARDARTTAET